MSKERNIKTIHSFFDFFEQKKFLEISEMFATDGKFVLPYHSGLFPPEVIGKKEIYEGWNNLSKNFSEITFPINEIMPIEDSSKVFVKFTGKLKFKNKAGYYENDYLFLFYFDDKGKIIELHEYFNPVISAKAFELMDKLCK